MMKPPTRMKATSTVTLIATITLLNFARFRNADDQQDGERDADQEGRQVEQIDHRRAVDEHVDAVLRR